MPNAERKLEERPDPGLVLLQDHAARHRRRWPGTRPREAGQVPDPASPWLAVRGQAARRQEGAVPGHGTARTAARQQLLTLGEPKVTCLVTRPLPLPLTATGVVGSSQRVEA